MTSIMMLNHTKVENYVISLVWGKLINRIPGLRHFISGLPGSALRTHVESIGKSRDVNKHSQSLA